MKDVNVLVTGRSRPQVAALESELATRDGIRVSSRLIVNGHTDPLYGVDPLPSVLVFAMAGEWWQELDAYAARPVEQRPPMLVVSEDDRVETVRAAMRTGARDFFKFPASGEELEQAVLSLSSFHQINEPVDRPRLIAVMNAKGGAGSSSIAVNLAAAAARRMRVVLVDLDIQSGSLPVYLDLDPSGGGLIDALEHAEELDPVAIEGYMLRHSSGLRVLAADTQRLLTHDDFNERSVRRLFDVLRSTYDLVIVDVPRRLDHVSATALAVADRVGLVLQQSVVHVREAKRLSRILTELAGIERERVIPLINRWCKREEIEEKDISRALGDAEIIRIPNDYERMRTSENTGVPIALDAPGSGLGKAFVSLLTDFGLVAEKRRDGLLNGLFTWKRG